MHASILDHQWWAAAHNRLHPTAAALFTVALRADVCCSGHLLQRWEFMADATVRLTSNTSVCMAAAAASWANMRVCNASSTDQQWFRDDVGQVRSLLWGHRALYPNPDTRVTGEVQLTDATSYLANAAWRFNGESLLKGCEKDGVGGGGVACEAEWQRPQRKGWRGTWGVTCAKAETNASKECRGENMAAPGRGEESIT